MALIILFVLAGLWFLPVGVGADSGTAPGAAAAAAPSEARAHALLCRAGPDAPVRRTGAPE